MVKGSTMFPRDRVRASLAKYNIPFDESKSDEELRGVLAGFYAKRTLTHQPIEPADCAEAILFLASPKTRCTSAAIFPVDGGLPEAFLVRDRNRQTELAQVILGLVIVIATDNFSVMAYLSEPVYSLPTHLFEIRQPIRGSPGFPGGCPSGSGDRLNGSLPVNSSTRSTQHRSAATLICSGSRIT